MRIALACVVALSLTGCSGGINDLRQYVAQVQASKVAYEEPEPVSIEVTAVPYQVDHLRSPFRLERAHSPDPPSQKSCPQPDTVRNKGALETFALDSFELKGVMTEAEQRWALVRAVDGRVHRLRKGDYLGLYHGRVAEIGINQLTVTEWIPDARGCWTQRDTSIAMAR